MIERPDEESWGSGVHIWIPLELESKLTELLLDLKVVASANNESDL